MHAPMQAGMVAHLGDIRECTFILTWRALKHTGIMGHRSDLGSSKSHLDQKHHLSRGLVCGDWVEGLLELAHLHLDAHACRQAQQL